MGALKDFSVFERRCNNEPEPADYRSYYFTNQMAKDRFLVHWCDSGFVYINAENGGDFFEKDASPGLHRAPIQKAQILQETVVCSWMKPSGTANSAPGYYIKLNRKRFDGMAFLRLRVALFTRRRLRLRLVLSA